MSDPQGPGPRVPSWMPTFIALNGLGMAWWEVVEDHFDRPYLLVLIGALCSGIPAQVIIAFTEWLTGRREGARGR